MSPYNFTADADRIAVARPRKSASLRSGERYRADVGGVAVAVTLPDPEAVAAALSASADLRRKAKAVFDGASVVTAEELADGVAAALESLPDREHAEEAYADLRLAARAGGPVFRGRYVPAVVRAWRASLPVVVTVSRERGAAKPTAVLQAERRARRRAEEVLLSRLWIEEALTNSAPVAGTRLPGAKLYAAATRYFEAKVEELGPDAFAFSDLVDPDAEVTPVWTVPPRVAFFEGLEQVLTKKRGSGGVEFVV